MGIIYLMDSIGDFSGNTMFSDNIGSLFAVNSNIYIRNNTIFVNCTSSIHNGTTFQEGGAITIFQSETGFSSSYVMIHITVQSMVAHCMYQKANSMCMENCQ